MATKKDSLSVISNDGLVDAVVSKLVDNRNENQRKKPHEPVAPNKNLMDQMSTAKANINNDVSSITEILPDVELAMQVLVSSILSPKDMVSTELNFTLSDIGVDEEIGSGVIRIIEKHFEKTYKIKDDLAEILNDILFHKGSYPIVVLPESTIDEVINNPTRVSMESMSGELDSKGRVKSLGLLGTGKGDTVTDEVSLESLISFTNTAGDPIKGIGDYVEITDNPSALKLPQLHRRIAQDHIADKLSVIQPGLEALRESESGKDNGDSPYGIRRYKRADIVHAVNAAELDAKTRGAPLVMKLPAEAVIPVHVPGDPKEHVGYYVLLDNQGNPISKSKTAKHYAKLQDRLNNDSSMSEMISQAREAMFGDGANSVTKNSTREELERSYVSLVESNLEERLRSGVYGNTVELSNADEIYRIMFSRALCKMKTQVLFIPAELMTYMAFDYDDEGFGKSLMEGSRIIASIRSMLMFANTMASLKNSVPHTALNIDLDPNDAFPGQTVEVVMHEHYRNQVEAFPAGLLEPTDITNYLQKSNTSVNVSGNPRYPTTKVSVSDEQRSVNNIDDELNERMRKQHIMKFGLALEHIEAASGADFATNVTSSNLLLAKRVSIWQDLLSSHLSDHIRKYVLGHGSLMEELLAYFKDGDKDSKKGKSKKKDDDEKQEEQVELLDVINAVTVSLPRPDTAKLENQVAAFEQYRDALDMALEAYFSEDMFEGFLESDMVDGVLPTIQAIRSYYLRQWLRKNNVLSELDLMLEQDEDGNPLFDVEEVHEKHVKGFLDAVGDLMRKLRKKDRKFERDIDKDIEKEEEDLAAEEEEAERLRQEAEGGSEDEFGSGEEGGEETGGEEPTEGDDLGGEEPTEDDATGGDEPPIEDDGAGTDTGGTDDFEF